MRRRSHRGSSYDVLAVFGHDQKPGCDFRDCSVSYDHSATSCDIARRHATSRIFIPYFHICTAFSRCCVMFVRRLTKSYELAQPSHDFNWVPTMVSASQQTIVMQSYNLVRLSYDGRTISYNFHTIATILYIPAIESQIRCDHKVNIVISWPSRGQ